MPSRRRPSPATCSCSIARRACRCFLSKSTPCQRRTSRASRPGRRSRCRSSRRPSRARRSPRPTSPMSRRRHALPSWRSLAKYGPAGSSFRPAPRAPSSFRGLTAAPSGAARPSMPTAVFCTSTANEMPWILSMVEIDQTKESTDFARGRRTYQLNCTACHGVDRQGDPAKVFPSLVTLSRKMPKAEADKIIAGGKAVMPAFPALSARERAGAAGVSLQRQTCGLRRRR